MTDFVGLDDLITLPGTRVQIPFKQNGHGKPCPYNTNHKKSYYLYASRHSCGYTDAET